MKKYLIIIALFIFATSAQAQISEERAELLKQLGNFSEGVSVPMPNNGLVTHQWRVKISRDKTIASEMTDGAMHMPEGFLWFTITTTTKKTYKFFIMYIETNQKGKQIQEKKILGRILNGKVQMNKAITEEEKKHLIFQKAQDILNNPLTYEQAILKLFKVQDADGVRKKIQEKNGEKFSPQLSI